MRLEYLFLTLWVLMAVGCLWFMACSTMTLNQRLGFLRDNIRPGAPDFDRRMKLLEAVAYGQHCWQLFTFRNPKKLYDPLLFTKPEPTFKEMMANGLSAEDAYRRCFPDSPLNDLVKTDRRVP